MKTELWQVEFKIDGGAHVCLIAAKERRQAVKLARAANPQLSESPLMACFVRHDMDPMKAEGLG